MIVERDFADHWKTQLVSAQLGEGAPLAIIRLWAHCEARRDDTFEMSSEVLRAIVRLPQKGSEIERVLIEARLIERRGKRIFVRGWRERNSRLLAAIANGKKGGRPRKPPAANPNEPTKKAEKTDGFPTDNPNETSKMRVEELREEPPLSPPRVRAVEGDADFPSESALDALLLAKKRVCRMFGTDAARPWSPDAEKNLRAMMPIPELEWAAVEWLHALGEDAQRPKVAQSPRTLLQNWPDEVAKAQGYAKKCGVEFGVEQKNAAPEPDGWRDWLAAAYPTAAVPERFGELPASVREEFHGGAAA
jgi:hypothetical protein